MWRKTTPSTAEDGLEFEVRCHWGGGLHTLGPGANGNKGGGRPRRILLRTLWNISGGPERTRATLKGLTGNTPAPHWENEGTHWDNEGTH